MPINPTWQFVMVILQWSALSQAGHDRLYAYLDNPLRLIMFDKCSVPLLFNTFLHKPRRGQSSGIKTFSTEALVRSLTKYIYEVMIKFQAQYQTQNRSPTNSNCCPLLSTFCALAPVIQAAFKSGVFPAPLGCYM